MGIRKKNSRGFPTRVEDLKGLKKLIEVYFQDVEHLNSLKNFIELHYNLDKTGRTVSAYFLLGLLQCLDLTEGKRRTPDKISVELVLTYGCSRLGESIVSSILDDFSEVLAECAQKGVPSDYLLHTLLESLPEDVPKGSFEVLRGVCGLD